MAIVAISNGVAESACGGRLIAACMAAHELAPHGHAVGFCVSALDRHRDALVGFGGCDRPRSVSLAATVLRHRNAHAHLHGKHLLAHRPVVFNFSLVMGGPAQASVG